MAFYITGFSYLPRYQPLFHWAEEPAGWREHWAMRGYPAPSETVPKKAILQTSHKAIPDFFPLVTATGVNRAFRDIVEELEPDVHQFFPVELFRKDGAPIPGEYFVLNVCCRLHAIIIQKSNINWDVTTLGNPVLSFGAGPPRFTLSAPVISNHHLWQAKELYTGGRFVSDALMKRLDAAKIRKIPREGTEDVDEPATPLIFSQDRPRPLDEPR